SDVCSSDLSWIYTQSVYFSSTRDTRTEISTSFPLKKQRRPGYTPGRRKRRAKYAVYCGCDAPVALPVGLAAGASDSFTPAMARAAAVGLDSVRTGKINCPVWTGSA